MDHTVNIGTKLEHFEIVGHLGKGGAGAVFKAKNLLDGKEYALKTLTPATVFNEEIHKRFIREISVAQKLKHENIVAYDHCGFSEDILYYTMELVPWGTLGEVLARKQRLPWQDAVECAIDICRGLEHLHQAQIVHRDLKPANIFLSDDGRLKLGDFGLARDLGAERLTLSGFTVGTAKYLAPEQAMAKANIDGRTDLYALGCLLFEMVAGRPPFLSRSPNSATNFREMMGKHVKEKPPRITDFVADSPVQLADLVDKLLSKNTTDRPDSATAVITSLQSILKESRLPAADTMPTTGQPALSPESLTHRLKGDDPQERKVNKRALAVVAAIVVIGIIVAMTRSRQP